MKDPLRLCVCAGLSEPYLVIGAVPGFLRRGFICINMCVWVCVCGGVLLLILSHFS